MKLLAVAHAMLFAAPAFAASYKCTDSSSTHTARLTFSEESLFKSFDIQRGNGGFEHDADRTWVETHYYEEKTLQLELRDPKQSLTIHFPVKRYYDSSFEDERDYFVGSTRQTPLTRGYDISLLSPRREHGGWDGYGVWVREFEGVPFSTPELGRYLLTCQTFEWST
jgi:hypothetical protein